MRFKPDEIVSVLQSEIEHYQQRIDTREVGRVLEVGDGIARVYGLSGLMAGEMVEFTRAGVRGLAFNLEENSVGIIVLGNYLEIEEGDEVRSLGILLEVGDLALQDVGDFRDVECHFRVSRFGFSPRSHEDHEAVVFDSEIPLFNGAVSQAG